MTLEEHVIPKSLTMAIAHADGGPFCNQPIKTKLFKMAITKEQAELMRLRVHDGAMNHLNRQNSPPNERTHKTATTVGAKAERNAWAATAQPKRKKNTEYEIQKAFVKKMGDKYPHVLIFSDAAAHVAKSMIQQVRANALQSPGQKWPDVFVAQPSGDYAGLFLEFKAETPYKIDGVILKKSDHVEAQAATMERLRDKGYFCDFVWTVEMAMAITEKYLNQ